MYEDAFSSLANHWRHVFGTMEQWPDTVSLITDTTVLLPNFIRIGCHSIRNELSMRTRIMKLSPCRAWQAWTELTDVQQHVKCTRDHLLVKMQHEYLCKYFNSPAGAVLCQHRLLISDFWYLNCDSTLLIWLCYTYVHTCMHVWFIHDLVVIHFVLFHIHLIHTNWWFNKHSETILTLSHSFLSQVLLSACKLRIKVLRRLEK